MKPNKEIKNKFITIILKLSTIVTLLHLSFTKSTNDRRRNLKADKEVVDPHDEKNKVLSNDINSPLFYKHQWKFLFKTPDRPSYACRKNVDLIPIKNRTQDDQDDRYLNSLVPIHKPDMYKAKRHGRDDSAYVFDWLDGFLLKDVVQLFKQYFKEAKEIPDSLVYPDIYNVTNQLEAFKTMGVGDFIVLSVHDTPEVQDRLLENLAKINKRVKPQVYKNGISISQFVATIELWRYRVNRDLLKWQKRMFDKFDKDGDGRLSPSEFLLFTIVHNYKTKTLGTSIGTHKYWELTREKIDGLFTFADCDGNGFISAEDLWFAMKELKRDSIIENKYNMYKCNAYSEMPEEYRSAAVNDFVLKNAETVYGLLNMEEFRSGLLLGFWSRQVSDLDIVDGDQINEKGLRWSEDGMTDYGCERIKDTRCINCDPNDYRTEN